jgi:hypothetical protein
MYNRELPPVSVMTFNRPELTKCSMKSLLSTEHGDISIYDDGSEEETWKIIADLAANLPFIEVHRNKGRPRGADANTYYLCSRSARKANGCFFLTSNDFVYARTAFTMAARAYLRYRNTGLLGLFNASNHQGVLRRLDSMREQVTLTGPVLVSSNFWLRAEATISQQSTDWSMAENCHKYNYRVLCFEESLCQHIGIIEGIHTRNADIGYRFAGEDGTLKFGRETGCHASLVEYWRHRYQGGENDLLLYDDGTAKFGGVRADWSRDGQTLTIHDDWWTHIVSINGPRYSGTAYPVGTCIVGYPVEGMLIS